MLSRQANKTIVLFMKTERFFLKVAPDFFGLVMWSRSATILASSAILFSSASSSFYLETESIF